MQPAFNDRAPERGSVRRTSRSSRPWTAGTRLFTAVALLAILCLACGFKFMNARHRRAGGTSPGTGGVTLPTPSLYFRFETNVNDSVSTNHLTAVGSSTGFLEEGKIASSLFADPGFDGWLEFTNTTAAVDVGGANTGNTYELAFWLYLDSGNFADPFIFGRWPEDGASERWGVFYDNATQILSFEWAGTTLTPEAVFASVPQDGWHLISVGISTVPADVYLYVDGVLQDFELATGGQLIDATNAWQFGVFRPTGNMASFYLDEFALFTNQLNDVQRQLLYNSGAGKVYYSNAWHNP